MPKSMTNFNPPREKTSDLPGRTLTSHTAAFTKQAIRQIPQPISTGFPALDRCLNGGLTRGTLYILGAIPGLGKSSLALQISHHLSRQGVPVLYFALEMSPAAITAKAICRADFAQNRTAANALSSSDLFSFAACEKAGWERINRARAQVAEEGKNLFLYGQESEPLHVGHIRERIHAFQKQYTGEQPILVVVDYLQLLAPLGNFSNLSDKQAVDASVGELCRIRDKEQVIILLISALNRISYNRPITLESFKESGSIEYSADVILGMQYQGVGRKNFSMEAAKEQVPRQLELTLLKMRYGQDGVRIPLQFYSGSSYFQDPEEGEPAAEPQLQQLRQRFQSLPAQYHDGRYQTGRRLRGWPHG